MINIKSLALSAAIATGIAFAMPVATSQAMPAGPVKIQATQDNNIVQANHKKWKRYGWRRHHNRFYARICDPWEGCYRRRHFYRYYDEPYYGYGGYPYGYYHRSYGPGLGLQFRID